MVCGTPSLWVDIGLGPEELRINQVMNMGQTWAWEETGRDCWTGVIGNSVLSLKSAPITTFAQVHCGDLRDLDDYIHRTYSLHDLYDDWSAKMERVWEIAKWLPGCRILRQDPWETLISFLVSANNNISRIHSILGTLRQEYGEKLCEARDRTFYSFPPLSKLRELDEKTFKTLGFGYRARYMVNLCEMLHERGGETYLLSLRDHPRDFVREVLVSFPGIGAKVADCVALYSLDQTDAVPVDVHVYRLSRRYFPDAVPSKTKSLSPKVYEAIGDAFRDTLGCKAGWAQVLLFCAELPAFQEMLPEELQSNALQPLAITDVQSVTLDRYKDRHVQQDTDSSDNGKNRGSGSSDNCTASKSSSSTSPVKSSQSSDTDSSDSEIQVKFPPLRELRSGAVILKRNIDTSSSDSGSDSDVSLESASSDSDVDSIPKKKRKCWNNRRKKKHALTSDSDDDVPLAEMHARKNARVKRKRKQAAEEEDEEEVAEEVHNAMIPVTAEMEGENGGAGSPTPEGGVYSGALALAKVKSESDSGDGEDTETEIDEEGNPIPSSREKSSSGALHTRKKKHSATRARGKKKNNDSDDSAPPKRTRKRRRPPSSDEDSNSTDDEESKRVKPTRKQRRAPRRTRAKASRSKRKRRSSPSSSDVLYSDSDSAGSRVARRKRRRKAKQRKAPPQRTTRKTTTRRRRRRKSEIARLGSGEENEESEQWSDSECGRTRQSLGVRPVRGRFQSLQLAIADALAADEEEHLHGDAVALPLEEPVPLLSPESSVWSSRGDDEGDAAHTLRLRGSRRNRIAASSDEDGAPTQALSLAAPLASASPFPPSLHTGG